MPDQEVKNFYMGTKFRVKIERAASTKGVLGYTIETTDDDLMKALDDIEKMKIKVEALTPAAPSA
jgi:hypothetical protein